MNENEIIEYTASVTKKITVTRSLEEENKYCPYRIYVGTELYSLAQTCQEAIKKAGKYAEEISQSIEQGANNGQT